MHVRNTEFDSIWDNNAQLKSNIITLFNTDLATAPNEASNYTSTGFFNPKNNEKFIEYQQGKAEILRWLKKDGTTLEDCYSELYCATLGRNALKGPSGEIPRKIDYVIERMEEVDPSLKSLRESVRAGWTKL